MIRLFLSLIAAVLIVCSATPASAARHALLIGVADYDNPTIRPLSGPRNDVILLWRYLTANGFAESDIRVLAEGLPVAASIPRPYAEPTRANILDGFRMLAERAQTGDFVVVHFSGHGTTQPETGRSTAPEAGDRDQVLLPKDAGEYDAGARTIRNGLVDDEIGEALDRIREKGAVVWAIIDACHAGTVTRSGGDVTRGVQPDALGVPPAPALRSGAPAVPPQRGALVRDMGGKAALIGFFAVDSWTEAIEREFQFSGAFAPGPRGGPPRFGVFTYHLVRALHSGRAQTFRDLARVVSLDIASSGAIAQAPPPYFDGDLDRTIAGGAAQFARRFPATAQEGQLLIDAGALHGFDVDAEIAIYDGPLNDAKRMGAARITSADAARAIAEAPSGLSLSGGNLWVGVDAPGVSLRYRVGAAPNDPGERALLSSILRAALNGANGAPEIAVDIVEDGERDMDVRLANGRLWLTPEGRPLITDTNDYSRSLSIALAGSSEAQVAEELRKALFTLARAANLLRIASAAELGGGTSDDVQIVLERVRETDPSAIANARRACGSFSKPSPAAPLSSGDTAPMSHCDQVHVSITNRGDRDIFAGVLYLTPTGGIGLPAREWRQNGCVGLVPARSTKPLTVKTPLETWTRSGPSYAGPYRVLVFAIPRTQTTGVNLCHLLQPDVASARNDLVAMRNAGVRKGLLGLIDRVAASEPSLRSANPFEDSPEDASSVIVRHYTLDLRPPAGL